MLWETDELAAALGLARSPGSSGISIDTRTLRPGDLFVALQAERDGHDFVGDAFAKGAAAALVSRDIAGCECLVVDDTLAALRRLGAHARARGAARVVAVTGSVGKTTTKEMLRRALAAFGSVHAAEASFNNHIGVPLTLARMPREAMFAVLEIGMNHAGEILPLAKLAQPDAAIITAIERSHIGLLGSIEAIAAEKASIFAGLKPGGTAILPRDSAFYQKLLAQVPRDAKPMSFGAQAGADMMLKAIALKDTSSAVNFTLHGESGDFTLAAPGRHMAMNAMAVLAACAAIGLDVRKAAAALDGFAPVAGRGLRRRIVLPAGEALLLDESYNASGASMRAAFDVLALQPGRHVAVLGDMLELGDDAAAEHLGLKPDVIRAADIIFTCGPMMGRLFAQLPADYRGAHEADAVTLAPVVKAALRPNDAVLVKGSYGSRMRDIISYLESAA
jgi:UDP-N-acetylmuramoyl-tripeptide--D-alanyl-D-alanine ligase